MNNNNEKTTNKSLREEEIRRKKLEYELEGIPVRKLLQCHGLPVVAE